MGRGDFQATLHPTGPQDAIHPQGLRQTSERLRPQRLTGEIARDELIRRRRDHQRIGRRQGLQARRNIGRLPQRQGLVTCSRPDVAHHDETRMHAQAHRDRLPGGQRALGGAWSEGLQNAKARPDGPLGVVFMGHRIAKIHQHAIAEVLRHIAVKALDHLGAGLVIGAHHVPKVFGVQVARQPGRVHQVAE